MGVMGERPHEVVDNRREVLDVLWLSTATFCCGCSCLSSSRGMAAGSTITKSTGGVEATGTNLGWLLFVLLSLSLSLLSLLWSFIIRVRSTTVESNGNGDEGNDESMRLDIWLFVVGCICCICCWMMFFVTIVNNKIQTIRSSWLYKIRSAYGTAAAWQVRNCWVTIYVPVIVSVKLKVVVV